MGRISSNFTVVSRFENRATRVGIYLFTTLIVINATRDFSFFYEVVKHLPAPATRTYYESSVPK
jgi:hypothetical protein